MHASRSVQRGSCAGSQSRAARLNKAPLSIPSSRTCKARAAAAIPGAERKANLVDKLLIAKTESGKTFSQIALETGLTNVYVAQLFYNQSQLKPQYVEKLQAAVPALSSELLTEMQAAPSRRFDPTLIQEPSIYRLYEAIMHGGEGLKAIINEECGDGIMSAIDFYCSIDKVTGKQGEQRIVITMNGKYLPFVAQAVEDDVAHRHPKA